MSTLIDKRIAVRVSKKTKSPYLIRNNTQIAEFFVVTPEQSKYIKPVDMANLSEIPQGDPGLTAYLKKLLRTNDPGKKTALYGFRHLKILPNPRTAPQCRDESSNFYLNSKRKKNSIPNRAQNAEPNSINDLIRMTHF